jgi:hypothetical protein
MARTERDRSFARSAGRGVRRVALAAMLPVLLASGCRKCPQPEVACPPCECTCACEPAAVERDERNERIGELVASASRKMMHEDGAGCLADLDRVEAISEGLHERLAVTRGQCEMLTGRCAEGKARIQAWYERELALTPGRAAKTAEALASMRCRGGSSTRRDRLLVALQDLADGAYVNKRSAAFCLERIAVVDELGPKVKPRDAEDTSVTGGIRALFYTGAMCLARAEECERAYEIFRRGFANAGLDALSTEADREKVIRDSFSASIPLCKN